MLGKKAGVGMCEMPAYGEALDENAYSIRHGTAFYP